MKRNVLITSLITLLTFLVVFRQVEINIKKATEQPVTEQLWLPLNNEILDESSWNQKIGWNTKSTDTFGNGEPYNFKSYREKFSDEKHFVLFQPFKVYYGTPKGKTMLWSSVDYRSNHPGGVTLKSFLHTGNGKLELTLKRDPSEVRAFVLFAVVSISLVINLIFFFLDFIVSLLLRRIRKSKGQLKTA